MSHSNQMREYLLTGDGIKLIEPYVGAEGVLTGSARQAQEARERGEALARLQMSERRNRELNRRRAQIERQIAELRASIDAEGHEVDLLTQQEASREDSLVADRAAMAAKRGAAE
jgi:circadian clock protein KaiC